MNHVFLVWISLLEILAFLGQKQKFVKSALSDNGRPLHVCVTFFLIFMPVLKSFTFRAVLEKF
jgi:hypothetical protein